MDSRSTRQITQQYLTHCRDHRFIDTAFGGVKRRNRVVDVNELSIPVNTSNCFTGMFRFPEAYQEHCQRIGSVSKCPPVECYSDFVWFDIDSSDPAEALGWGRELVGRLKEQGDEIVRNLDIYFSGCKGFHIGIPSQLFGLGPSSDLPAKIGRIAKKLAEGITIDTCIYQRNQLWRVPNTKHRDSGLFKTKLTLEEFTAWSIDQIREKAQKAAGVPHVAYPERGDLNPHPFLLRIAESVDLAATRLPNDSGNQVVRNKPGWIGEGLKNLSDGNRNSTFAKITGRLHRDGWSPEDIAALLVPHASQVGFPPDELQTVVDGICDRYPSTTRFPVSAPIYIGNQEIRSETAIPFAQLLSQADKEIPWLVESLFPTEGIAIIGGAPGIGKSWLVLDLTLTCAAGGKWFNQFQTLQGPVLYVDEESYPPLLGKRCRQLVAGGKPEPIEDIHFLVGQGVSFTDSRRLSILEVNLERYRPKLVICDSLIRFHSAEENSASEMKRVFESVKELVREHHCFFVFADHNRKPGENATSSQHALRGSSEKSAAVDCQLSVSQAGDVLKVEHSKSRYGREIPAFTFKLREPRLGKIQLVYAGDVREARVSEQVQRAVPVILDCLSERDLVARKDIVSKGQGGGVGEKLIDNGLKHLVNEGKIERVDKRPDGGRGSKSAFYRLADLSETGEQS